MATDPVNTCKYNDVGEIVDEINHIRRSYKRKRGKDIFSELKRKSFRLRKDDPSDQANKDAGNTAAGQSQEKKEKKLQFVRDLAWKLEVDYDSAFELLYASCGYE